MGNAYIGVSNTYTPIDYIQANGGQWIDTGYSPNSNTKIEMMVRFTTNQQQTLWGARDYNKATPTNPFMTLFNISYRTKARVDFGTTGTDFSYVPTVNEFYTYTQDKNVFKEGSTVLYTAPTTTFTTTSSLLLFANKIHDGVMNCATVQLYYCKIWDNDTLVRDFVPVIGSDGIPCLWDKVQSKAYYNDGFDSFTAGDSAPGTSYTVSNVARKIKKIYVGANDVAKKVKKAYIGVNDTARLVYDSSYIYDLFGNTTKADANNSNFCVTHTTDYLIVSGGQQFNNATPSTATNAINENGVWTSCVALPTRASYQGSMSVNGYGIIASGKSASSGASRTNQCMAYDNNLTRSSLSTITQSAFEGVTASNSTHCIFYGGSIYSTTLSVQAQAYNGSLVKTTLPDASINRRGPCGAGLGNYIIICGGYLGNATSAVTDFYDNNNVKTTGAYPYSTAKNMWFNKGVSNGTYAMFAGGGSAESANNGDLYDDVIVYDTNLVVTRITFPIKVDRLQGFALGEAMILGTGPCDVEGERTTDSMAYVYNNTLTVQKKIPIVWANTQCYQSDANEKFGGIFGQSGNSFVLIKQ